MVTRMLINDNISLGFEFPTPYWLILFIFLGVSLVKVFKKYKASNMGKFTLFVLPFIFALSASLFIMGGYSLYKRNFIINEVESRSVNSLEGVIKKIDIYHGQSFLYIEEVVFRLAYTSLYCITNPNLFSEGDKVRVDFIYMHNFVGMPQEVCILRISNSEIHRNAS